MEQYKVEITKEALQDIEDIYNYIALELLSPENAMGQYNFYKLHQILKHDFVVSDFIKACDYLNLMEGYFYEIFCL